MKLKTAKNMNEILNKNLDTLRQSYADKILNELSPLPKVNDKDSELKNKEYVTLSRQADELMKVFSFLKDFL